jgi:homoserine kinase type II
MDLIVAALDSYPVGTVTTMEALHGKHRNTPHMVATGRGRFFVKVLAPEFSGGPALEVRHAFIEHLAARGVPVPRLERTRDGQTCARIGEQVVEVYQFVAGRTYRRGDAADAEAAGKALARLHRAALEFSPPTPGVRRGWLIPEADLARLARFEEQMRTYVPAPEAFAPVEAVKAAIREASAALAAAELPTAMTHGDFLPENLVHASVGGPVITDFDYCHVGPLVFDLAAAIIGFAGHESDDPGDSFGPDVATAVLTAYKSCRPLTEAENEVLQPAARRVLIHLHLDAGASPERIAGMLREGPLSGGS